MAQATERAAVGWRRRFRARLVDPEDAARLVKSGDLVRFPLGTVPATFVSALARRRSSLHDVRVIQGIPLYRYPWAVDPEWRPHVRLITDFVNVLIRPSVDAGVVDFQVVDFALGSRAAEGNRTDVWSADVYVAPVSEPDRHGYVSFGYGLWYNKRLLRAAKVKIAEVCKGFIRTGGDNYVHLSEFDYVIEQRERPPEVPFTPDLSQEKTETIEVIGAYVSTLIDDGDTVQLGTGTVSSSMGHYLMAKNDLGIDSEIIAPSVVELVKAGVATGRKKTSHVEKAIASYVVPGPNLDFVDANPAFELYDIEYINDVRRIAANERQVAVNQATAIDLTGQVTAESVGGRVWSGPGGQLVWTMGALFSRGGRAIHVLPSTAKDGTVSRIVPVLEPGSAVTVPRTFVDYVVTEYGVVNLQGKTLRERADELISIAHPDFRPALRREALRSYGTAARDGG